MFINIVLGNKNIIINNGFNILVLPLKMRIITNLILKKKTAWIIESR